MRTEVYESGIKRNNQIPRVTIGIPVFNGANYLAQAIDSILAQTWGNFELIISDNASTDETQEICRSYEARDQRIRYIRNEHNIGAAGNFNKLFSLARGRYFKWAAHDDVCAPEYLQRCVGVLDRYPSALIAYPRGQLIDEKGTLLPYDYPPEFPVEISSGDPITRYRSIMLRECWFALPIGLFRASALRKTTLFRDHYGGDRLLLCQLALQGSFYEVEDYL
ncbi:MAG: glycosyltransferase family 2 protein, partial [Pyrinomonadaceae bacterium]